MKLAIFDGEPEKRPVLLKLIEEGDNVTLAVVDAHGCVRDQGRLLSVTPSGMLYRRTGVGSSFGFKLEDATNRVGLTDRFS